MSAGRKALMRNVAFSLRHRKEAAQRNSIDAMFSDHLRCWLRDAGDPVRDDAVTTDRRCDVAGP